MASRLPVTTVAILLALGCNAVLGIEEGTLAPEGSGQGLGGSDSSGSGGTPAGGSAGVAAGGTSGTGGGGGSSAGAGGEGGNATGGAGGALTDCNGLPDGTACDGGNRVCGGHVCRNKYTYVTAGNDHACALSANGEVYCWGNNSHSQLGFVLPTDQAEVAPGRVPLSSVTWIDAGMLHTCAIAGEALYCWGDNSLLQVGVVGARAVAEPAKVDIANPTRVSAGSTHTCAIDSGNDVFCWGTVLGTDNNDVLFQSRIPTKVASLGWQVSAGAQHTCMAQKDTSNLLCWGFGAQGQLGLGNTNSAQQPTALNMDFGRVSAGVNHTCATDTQALGDGNHGLFCWGLNDKGQLGTGTTVSQSSPQRVSQKDGSALIVHAVSAGNGYTCAYGSETTGGQGWCWGENTDGRLGTGSTSSESRPTGIALGKTWHAIEVGSLRTCGVTIEGLVYCWGKGRTIPTPVDLP